MIPATTRALAQGRECFPVNMPPQASSVREFMARRGREPLVIERTEKRPGDLVLGNVHRELEVVS